MSLIGMPGLIELGGLEEQLDTCRRLGLDFVEIHMDMPTLSPAELDSQSVRALCDDRGVGATVHLPEILDLASFHDPIRESLIDICAETLRWCGQAGISLANMHMHPGVYFSLPDEHVYVYERYQERFRQRLLDAFTTLKPIAEATGVTLCVENTSSFENTHVAEVLDTLVKKGLVELTWDTGHDGSHGYAHRGFLLDHRDHVVHMHLHDFVGRSNHLPLYTGELDVDEVISFALARAASVVIEVKTLDALMKSVETLRDHKPNLKGRL